MKNAVIVVLVIALGIMGYLMFAENDNQNSESNSNTTNTTTADQPNPPVSSGSIIDLSNKGLTTLDKNILDNSKVTALDVSGNSLTGALPAEIRKLTNLELLNASANKMTGIPAEIGQLSKLRIINFSNNDISGLPLELGNLSNLETFDLRGNPNVSDYDLSQIKSKIPNAKILTD